MSRRDALEVLLAADPALGHPGLDPASPRGQAVLERAAATRPLVLDVRRRRAVVAVAVGLAVLGAAAAAWVATRRPTHTLSVGCYAQASLDANTYVISAREGQAVEACRELWTTGTFGAPSSPPLVACVLPSGAVGVFPGDVSTCAQLRRPPAPTAPPNTNTTLASDRVRVLQERLVAAYNATDCLDVDAAGKLAFGLLAELELIDWAVTPGRGGFTEERPCVSWYIDEPGKEVLLIPFPRR